MDNYYNSPQLSQILLKNGTDSYGTLNPRRKDVPKIFDTNKLRKGEKIAFRSGKIMALQWFDRKKVTMISTIHSIKDIRTKNYYIRTRKPEVIQDYNHNMGGVDKVDQCIQPYSCSRKRTKKYYKKIFYHLLDITIWNSYVLYNKVTNIDISHLNYRLYLIRDIH